MKNLYPHPDKKGRYIYLRNGKYVAERRHSMGFRQTNVFYTIEEAANWLLHKWPECVVSGNFFTPGVVE